jgi:hypothetical protein
MPVMSTRCQAIVDAQAIIIIMGISVEPQDYCAVTEKNRRRRRSGLVVEALKNWGLAEFSLNGVCAVLQAAPCSRA